MSEIAISAQGLSKRFKIRRTSHIKERFVRRGTAHGQEFWALRDATFEIPKGSMFGIVGHNGSGKSTALKVLAGIYRPTVGTVEVRGTMSALLELGAGFHPELTGRENIALNGSLLGMNRRRVEEITEEVIDFSGVGQFIDQPLKTYSSGMQVRLGFAIAVKVDPEILVVDEVIAVGDEEFQRRCFDYIYNLRSRGSTIVIVTHALGIVSDMCDQAMWLDHGEVKAQGEAREVVDSYLRLVNKTEKAQVQTSDDLATLDRMRHGSGEVRITGMQILGPDGEPASFLVTGEPGGLRLHYEARDPLEKGIISLSFFNENQINVAGHHSGGQGPQDFGVGAGCVDFVMDEVLMSPGTYRLTTAVVSGGSWIDALDRAFQVRVRSGGMTTAGLTLLPGHWDFGRASG